MPYDRRLVESYQLRTEDNKHAYTDPDKLAEAAGLKKEGEFYVGMSGRGAYYYSWNQEQNALVLDHWEH